MVADIFRFTNPIHADAIEKRFGSYKNYSYLCKTKYDWRVRCSANKCEACGCCSLEKGI